LHGHKNRFHCFRLAFNHLHLLLALRVRPPCGMLNMISRELRKRLDEPAVLSEAKTRLDEPAVLSEAKTRLDEPAVLSEAKTRLDEPAVLSKAKGQGEPAVLCEAKTRGRCGAGTPTASPIAASDSFDFTPNSDLLDEFGAEELAEMMALRARIHARAGISPDPKWPASKSGPRTAEGKATSSANSLKHGLASGRVVIPGEDPAAFEALLTDLMAEHAPANETESLLVQQMAQSWWLTQRAIRLQNQAFTETRVDTQKLALFLRYQTTHERAFYRAFNALIKLQEQRRKSDPEFVSQPRRKTRRTREFVSQNTASATDNPSSGQPESRFVPRSSAARSLATHVNRSTKADG
jgi:hypothetical protein